jgi:hypothetical protein
MAVPTALKYRGAWGQYLYAGVSPYPCIPYFANKGSAIERKCVLEVAHVIFARILSSQSSRLRIPLFIVKEGIHGSENLLGTVIVVCRNVQGSSRVSTVELRWCLAVTTRLMIGVFSARRFDAATDTPSVAELRALLKRDPTLAL